MAKTTTTSHQLARTLGEMMTTTMMKARKETTIQLTRMHLMTTLPMINSTSRSEQTCCVTQYSSMDGEALDGNSVGDNVSMGSDFSDSLTELRAGGRNYFGGRSVPCRIYNILITPIMRQLKDDFLILAANVINEFSVIHCLCS